MSKSRRTETSRKAERQENPLLKAVVAARSDLRALVMDAGFGVLGSLLEEDRAELCGERYARSEQRRAYRHGYDEGSLVMGGRGDRTATRRRDRAAGRWRTRARAAMVRCRCRRRPSERATEPCRLASRARLDHRAPTPRGQRPRLAGAGPVHPSAARTPRRSDDDRRRDRGTALCADRRGAPTPEQARHTWHTQPDEPLSE